MPQHDDKGLVGQLHFLQANAYQRRTNPLALAFWQYGEGSQAHSRNAFVPGFNHGGGEGVIA